MKPAAFAYAKARTLDQAVGLLEREPGARVLAGGQSLIATLNMRLDAPGLLVDINGIAGLDDIVVREGELEIGALSRHATLLASPVVARAAPLLAMALRHVAHAAIRNRGTIGGSIALADPAAELPACLLALGGEIEVCGPAGRRSIKADDFFLGLFETAMRPGEILTAVRVPAATPGRRYGFAELARRHGDYALVGLAAVAEASGDRLTGLRIVCFGVGATPLRARAAEAALAGGQDAAALDAAVAALADELQPEDDIHASAKARKHMAGVLLLRVVAQMRGTAA